MVCTAAGLTDAIQTAPVYIVIETTRTLKQSVIVGISASLCLALVMIALLTQDFRLAALATISIGLSVGWYIYLKSVAHRTISFPNRNNCLAWLVTRHY